MLNCFKNWVLNMNKKKLLPFLIFATLFSSEAVSESNKSETSSQNDPQMPSLISRFKGLDFDKRSELKEYIIQKKQLLFFNELIDSHLKNVDSTLQENYRDIVSLGKTLSDLDIKTNNVGQVAKLCGFHRLNEFYNFKKNPKNKECFFLDKKEPQYASALSQEMMDFDEISSRLDLWDSLFLKRNLMIENWRYQEKHPNFREIYRKQLSQKIKHKIQNEQKILVKNR